MAKEYYIPVNFNQSGRVFNGLIETRKAVEACCGVLLGFLLCKLLPLPKGVVAISFYVFFCVGLGLFGFIGIRGEPVSTFLWYVWKWKKIRKKPYFYDPNGDAYTVTSSQIYMEEASAQDALADLVDGFRDRFSREAPEYIEGVTYTFAEDPFQERLRNAQERQQEDQASDENSADSDVPAPDGTDNLDLDDVMGDIGKAKKRRRS